VSLELREHLTRVVDGLEDNLNAAITQVHRLEREVRNLRLLVFFLITMALCLGVILLATPANADYPCDGINYYDPYHQVCAPYAPAYPYPDYGGVYACWHGVFVTACI
jgi:hypothetical protein